MSIGIVDGYSPRPPMRRKPEPTIAERIMKRECDLGMCEIAGHDHSGVTYDNLLSAGKIHKSQYRGGYIAGSGPVPLRPPPKAMTVPAVDAYRAVKLELERVQKELAATRMEIDEFKQKFSYRKYESNDFENEYTVHEITAFGGEKMIYTEKYPKFSNYVGYREEYNKSERQIAREIPKIPTKKVWR